MLWCCWGAAAAGASCLFVCAGLRIKENKEVYEGEVTELTPEETEAPGGGFQKAISHVVIGLRTVRRGRPSQS